MDILEQTTQFDYFDGPDTRPAFDFHTGARTTLRCRQFELSITDARTLADAPQIEREGFELVNHKTSVSMSDDRETIDRIYHEEVGSMLKERFGAYLVIPFRIGLLIRKPPKEDGFYRDQMKGTRIAHLDYTDNSMDMWVRVCAEMEGVDPGEYKRMAVYQTWRMFAPGPQQETLALCDARTVKPGGDVVFDSIISDDDRQTFESRVMKYSPDHSWYYWSNLTRDEMLLFKGYDTDLSLIRDVPHQAITTPGDPAGRNPRESIETRFFLFFR
ncbi:hypothetical protein OKA06_11595 [Novosphingobium sp. MW5]|nr:hypothetical protein [Novosphingobium sp. MW5]